MLDKDLQAYWKKIGFMHAPPVSLAGLTQLHQAQHRRLPFENFDVVLQREVQVTPEAIVQKLVYQARGGYCFELNGLLLQVLQASGFEARSALGRVHLSGRASGRGHFILLVTIEGQHWVVDAGFGSHTPRAPLPLVTDQVLWTDQQCFRFIHTEEYGYLLQRCMSVVGTLDERERATFDSDNAEWMNLYSFDLESVCEGDIAYGNFYTSHAPTSVFVTSRIAALPTEAGSITLLNQTVKVVADGETTIIELPEGDAYVEALNTYFGIRLTASFDQFRPLPAII